MEAFCECAVHTHTCVYILYMYPHNASRSISSKPRTKHYKVLFNNPESLFHFYFYFFKRAHLMMRCIS